VSHRTWTPVPAIAALALLAAASLTAVAVNAQQAAAPGSKGPSAGEKYMNVQVLKDLPASQLPDAMAFMAASLGANCGFCHVRTPQGEWAFDKDDKPEKKTARKMLSLTHTINQQYFDGQQTVTCASCHQARHEPSPQPPLSQPFTADQLALMATRVEGQRPPAPAETVDQVLGKYVQALGGADAVGKVTSLVMRGSAANRAGQSSPVVVEQVSPGRYRSSVEGKPPMTRAFDGTTAWLDVGGHPRELEGVQQAYTTALADLGLPLRLKQTYERLSVGRYDRIDGHDAIMLNGRPSPAVMETLWFDRGTGLLLRRVARLQTPMGRLPLQIDYADYRDVQGVKFPFEVKVTDWENVQAQKFTEVKPNAPVPADRFAAPKM
jgi:photosynthetic reaction center cytochrome c subunit